jgi:tetratricopeptide (TPR) repeat protein
VAFRFWRRIRLLPGVTLNLSKSGPSLSIGPRGAKVTIGGRGVRKTLGMPGTGLSYSVHTPWASGAGQSRGGAATGGRRPPPRPSVRERLDFGMLERLRMPAADRALIDGWKAYADGDGEQALRRFESVADNLPDAAWIAGMIHLGRRDVEQAQRRLEQALHGLDRLGRKFVEYGIDCAANVWVTPEVEAEIRPRERGTRLALAEIALDLGDVPAALAHLEALLALDGSDPVVLASLSECLLARETRSKAVLERVVALTNGIENETPVHAAVLLYRARALSALGLPDAAIGVYTIALRRRKDRDQNLLHQLRYERALLYAAQRQASRARREFESIYAEAPDFEDVRARLEANT